MEMTLPWLFLFFYGSCDVLDEPGSGGEAGSEGVGGIETVIFISIPNGRLIEFIFKPEKVWLQRGGMIRLVGSV